MEEQEGFLEANLLGGWGTDLYIRVKTCRAKYLYLGYFFFFGRKNIRPGFFSANPVLRIFTAL